MFIYKNYELKIDKEIRCTLQQIYGIGWYKSNLICSKLGLSYPFLFKHLNAYNRQLLFFILDFYTWLEVRIKRVIYQNIKRYFDISSYLGIRHKDRLPVRGQRTRSNARTKKGFKYIYD